LKTGNQQVDINTVCHTISWCGNAIPSPVCVQSGRRGRQWGGCHEDSWQRTEASEQQVDGTILQVCCILFCWLMQCTWWHYSCLFCSGRLQLVLHFSWKTKWLWTLCLEVFSSVCLCSVIRLLAAFMKMYMKRLITFYL